MNYFALPEEQAEMLVSAHRKRALRLVVWIPRERPAQREVPVEREALLESFGSPWITKELWMRWYVREACAPGELVWLPEEDGSGGPELDGIKSGAVQVWPCLQLDGELTMAIVDRVRTSEYKAEGVEAKHPRRVHRLLVEVIGELCTHAAAPEEVVEAATRGELPLAEVEEYAVPASPGAIRFCDEGGQLSTLSQAAEGARWIPLTSER